MRTNLRGKIREFIESEEGKVGVKSPLTLGATVGGVLLAQAIVGTMTAESAHAWQCRKGVDDDCRSGETCSGPFSWDEERQALIGTCYL